MCCYSGCDLSLEDDGLLFQRSVAAAPEQQRQEKKGEERKTEDDRKKADSKSPYQR